MYDPKHNNIEGFMNERELIYLYTNVHFMVEKFKPAPINVLEVGTWMGRSADALASAMSLGVKGSCLVTVDNWSKDDSGENDEHRQAALSRYFKNRSSIIKELNFREKGLNWNTIIASSEEARKAYVGKKFHFIFIDADHSYEAVKKDLELWYPLLEEGGILMGHDYRPQVPHKVKKAVDEFFGKEKMILRHSSLFKHNKPEPKEVQNGLSENEDQN
jgi:predicted O-methyltransferase YrrM